MKSRLGAHPGLLKTCRGQASQAPKESTGMENEVGTPRRLHDVPNIFCVSYIYIYIYILYIYIYIYILYIYIYYTHTGTIHTCNNVIGFV